MAEASGISEVGTQLLLYDSVGLRKCAVFVGGGFPAGARYAGYISIEVYNGQNSFQVAGLPLWYEGVLLSVPAEFPGLPYSVVATWRLSGLNWNAVTFD